MTTYTITIWTDLQGIDRAKCVIEAGEFCITLEAGQRHAAKRVARQMLDTGCDPTARVYFVNERGGKLGSVASLAELGRVRG